VNRAGYNINIEVSDESGDVTLHVGGTEVPRHALHVLPRSVARAALESIAAQREDATVRPEMAVVMEVRDTRPIVFERDGETITADRIQSATVGWADEDGNVVEEWSVVAGKDMSVGDRVVLFKPDAIVDKSHPALSFMGKRSATIKMARFLGAPSEALALPADDMLPDVAVEVGQDVTIETGILKYEKPVPAGTNIIGAFPSDVSKTDEMRWQAVPHVVRAMVGKRCYATVKCDGTSQTLVWRTDDTVDAPGLHGYSRNWELAPEPNSLPFALFERYGLAERLSQLGRNIAIQFETVGPGIQKNPMRLSEQDMRVFTVQDLDENRRLSATEMRALCDELGVPMVDTAQVDKKVWVLDGSMTQAEYDALPADKRTFEFWDIEFRPEWADSREVMTLLGAGVYPGTNKPREGVVVRTMENHRVPLGDHASFKVINLDY